MPQNREKCKREGENKPTALLEETCHCEPVTDVTGVAIRIPVPMAPLRQGRLLCRAGQSPAPAHRLPIEFRRGRRPRRPAPGLHQVTCHPEGRGSTPPNHAPPPGRTHGPCSTECRVAGAGDRMGRPYAFLPVCPQKKRWPSGHLSIFTCAERVYSSSTSPTMAICSSSSCFCTPHKMTGHFVGAPGTNFNPRRK